MSLFLINYTYDHPDGTMGIKGVFNEVFHSYSAAETYALMNREGGGYRRYDFEIREVEPWKRRTNENTPA